MNILMQIQLIVLGLGIAYAVVVMQIFILARIYRSWSWWIGAATIIALATRQLYLIIKVPTSILEAHLRGYMIDHLSSDQWVQVGWQYLVAVGFIVWMDWQRRDLQKLGVAWSAAPQQLEEIQHEKANNGFDVGSNG